MPPPVLSSAARRSLERSFFEQDVSGHGRLAIRLLRAGHRIADLVVDHPCADEIQDFTRLSLAQAVEAHQGWVYVAGNPAQRGFYKVGKTGLTPQARMRALSNEAVIGRMVLVDCWAVPERHGAETLAHRALQDLPRHKEFFAGAWQAIVDRVAVAVGRDVERFTQEGVWKPPPAASLTA